MEQSSGPGGGVSMEELRKVVQDTLQSGGVLGKLRVTC